MDLPPIVTRGGQLYADFRAYKGPRHVRLGLPVGSSDLEVGIVVGRKLEAFRLAGQIQAPELPGLERTPGQLLADVILLHADSREYDTDAGEQYARGVCRRIARDLGHLELAVFDGHAGDVVILKWKEALWARGIGGQTTRNYIKQLFKVLKWAQSRRLIVSLPGEPKRLNPEGTGPVYVPNYQHWTEEDFRHLREHWADMALAKGYWNRVMPDPKDQLDFVARRRLYLSVAYYTGMHTFDLDRVKAEWLSWEVGRYRRVNHKSAACVREAIFDMPEQLREDCRAEAERCAELGFPWRPDDLVCGGPWPIAPKMLGRAVPRLWPDERTRPCPWNFRIARRSCAWEYCIRGWSAESIAEILGHVDRKMVDAVYRRADELRLISSQRIPWARGTAPRGQQRTCRAKVLDFRR
jgi:integrase